MNATLRITSSNPDLCGEWNREDIEAEMLDIGQVIRKKTSWIDYVVTRVFIDSTEPFPKVIEQCLEQFVDSKFNATFELDGEELTIEYSAK